MYVCLIRSTRRLVQARNRHLQHSVGRLRQKGVKFKNTVDMCQSSQSRSIFRSCVTVMTLTAPRESGLSLKIAADRSISIQSRSPVLLHFQQVYKMRASNLDLSQPSDILTYLAETPFASTLVTPLSGGYANFTFRLHLSASYKGQKSVVLKHAKPYVAMTPSWPFAVERQVSCIRSKSQRRFASVETSYRTLRPKRWASSRRCSPQIP